MTSLSKIILSVATFFICLENPAFCEEKAKFASAQIPLFFIPNEGQLDQQVKFYAQGRGVSFYFTAKEAVFSFQKRENQETVLKMRFLGANPKAQIEGRKEGTGKVNYFIGNDPSKWKTNLPTYQEIIYKELWPGIDMIFRGAEGKLKYEWVVQPKAKIKKIQLSYEGVEGVALDEEGNLKLKTASGEMTDERPQSYQMLQGKKMVVPSRYYLLTQSKEKNAYGIKIIGKYDSKQPLFIDPLLDF